MGRPKKDNNILKLIDESEILVKKDTFTKEQLLKKYSLLIKDYSLAETLSSLRNLINSIKDKALSSNLRAHFENIVCLTEIEHIKQKAFEEGYKKGLASNNEDIITRFSNLD